MRKAALALLVALIALALLSPTQAARTGAGGSKPIVRVDHVITVLKGGLVELNDTFYVINTGVRPMTEFSVLYPRELMEKALELSVTQGGEPVELEPYSPRGDLAGFNMTLPDPVEWEEESPISVHAVFYGLLNSSSGQSFNFSFPISPTTPWGVDRCTTKLVIPKGGSFQDVPEGFSPIENRIERVFRRLPPFSINFTNAKFSYSMPYLDCRSLVVRVRVDQLGGISVTERYVMVNMAGDPLSSIELRVPKDATGIKVNDGFADMDFEVKELEGCKQLSPTLRAQVQTGQRLTLVVAYKLSKSRLSSDPLASHYSLSYDLLAWNNWSIDYFRLEVDLPEGARAISASPTPSVMGRDYAVYEYRNFTLDENFHVSLEYGYSLAWSIVPYVGWLSLAVVALIALGLTLRFVKPVAPPPILPVEDLSRFLELYSRKVALYDRLARLDEDLDRKKIRRREYRDLVRKAREELDRLTRELKEVKRRVASIDSEHGRYVTQLEAAEAEIMHVRDDIVSLRRQRRLGRISKEVYERLIAEYKGRFKRARGIIDRVLATLREEIS